MRKQHEQVIKPLTMEVKIREELIRRMKGSHDANLKELKMLNSIIRIPKLCQDF